MMAGRVRSSRWVISGRYVRAKRERPAWDITMTPYGRTMKTFSHETTSLLTVEEDTHVFFRKMLNVTPSPAHAGVSTMPDFIEVFPKVLAQRQCDEIIATFESSGQAARSR